MSETQQNTPEVFDWGIDREAIEQIVIELQECDKETLDDISWMRGRKCEVHPGCDQLETIFKQLSDASKEKLLDLQFLGPVTIQRLTEDASQADVLTPNLVVCNTGELEESLEETAAIEDAQALGIGGVAADNDIQPSGFLADALRAADPGSCDTKVREVVFPTSVKNIDPAWEPVQLGLMMTEGGLRDKNGYLLDITDDTHLFSPFTKEMLCEYLLSSNCDVDDGGNDLSSKVQAVHNADFGDWDGSDPEKRHGFLVELKNVNKRKMPALVFLSLVRSVVPKLTANDAIGGRIIVLNPRIKDPRAYDGGMDTYGSYAEALAATVADCGDVIDVKIVTIGPNQDTRKLEETYFFRENYDEAAEHMTYFPKEKMSAEKSARQSSIIKSVQSNVPEYMINDELQAVSAVLIRSDRILFITLTLKRAGCGFTLCGFAGVYCFPVSRHRRGVHVSLHHRARHAGGGEVQERAQAVRHAARQGHHFAFFCPDADKGWAVACHPLCAEGGARQFPERTTTILLLLSDACAQ